MEVPGAERDFRELPWFLIGTRVVGAVGELVGATVVRPDSSVLPLLVVSVGFVFAVEFRRRGGEGGGISGIPV